MFDSIGEWVASTRLPEQVREVDFAGLFTNPWFMVPFVALVGYLLYKKALRDLVILGAILGMWWASGTTYMQTLVVDGELQINKVLPVLFGGAAVLGLAPAGYLSSLWRSRQIVGVLDLIRIERGQAPFTALELRDE